MPLKDLPVAILGLGKLPRRILLEQANKRVVPCDSLCLRCKFEVLSPQGFLQILDSLDAFLRLTSRHS